jgi:hypothetical protein
MHVRLGDEETLLEACSDFASDIPRKSLSSKTLNHSVFPAPIEER